MFDPDVVSYKYKVLFTNQAFDHVVNCIFRLAFFPGSVSSIIFCTIHNFSLSIECLSLLSNTLAKAKILQTPVLLPSVPSGSFPCTRFPTGTPGSLLIVSSCQVLESQLLQVRILKLDLYLPFVLLFFLQFLSM